MARKPDKRRDKNRPRGGKSGLSRYKKTTVKMPENHGWKCAEGYNIFVANRGDVRFEFPESFINSEKDDAILLHDKPVPHDSCRISLSVWRLPIEAGMAMMRDVPIRQLVAQTTDPDLHEERSREREAEGETVFPPRGPRRDHDPGSAATSSGAPASGGGTTRPPSRGRGGSSAGTSRRVHLTSWPLISFEYYEDRADDFAPAFDHLMETLRIAQPGDDGRADEPELARCSRRPVARASSPFCAGPRTRTGWKPWPRGTGASRHSDLILRPRGPVRRPTPRQPPAGHALSGPDAGADPRTSSSASDTCWARGCSCAA